MRRRSTRIAGALTVALACTAAAAPMAQAAHPADTAPAAPASALTDTLGTTLGNLLGSGSERQQLQDLLTQLQSGQAPTGAQVAPLQDLLIQLAATPALPADVQALIAQLAGLLGSGPAGEPLDPALLMPVATLLRDLAGTSGVPADASALLKEIADLLDGSGAAPGLPVDALTLPPALIDSLRELLNALEQGQQPTGTLLAPVGDLLDTAAATPQLPESLAALLSQLADALEGTSGSLDPLLADQVSYALDSIASTPGLSPGQSTTIERISTFVSTRTGASAGAKARTATKRDRAVIKRIRVNKARTRVGVRIACPSSAPTTCATTVTAKLGTRKAARGKHVRIAAGRAKLVRLKIVSAARTASVRQGGRLRVRVVTAFGSQRFAATKAVKLKARHHR
ncbi:MAG TPA: hypothetical protein VGO48_14160 [Conexibacter sp.]|jgi:hypothetical protein|nr:hypothetical protein [Conexibacter sp.]